MEPEGPDSSSQSEETLTVTLSEAPRKFDGRLKDHLVLRTINKDSLSACCD